MQIRAWISPAVVIAVALTAGCSNDKPSPSPASSASPASQNANSAAPATPPAPPAAPNAAAWDGVATGAGANGGTWVIHIYNCTSDPLGPWKGKFTFTNSSGGVNMNFASEEFSFQFPSAAAPVKAQIKTKGKAIAGAPIKVDFDLSTDVEMRTDPGKTVTLTEKSQGGTVTGTTPGGAMGASLFGGANSAVTIPLKPVAQCSSADPGTPPAQPKK